MSTEGKYQRRGRMENLEERENGWRRILPRWDSSGEEGGCGKLREPHLFPHGQKKAKLPLTRRKPGSQYGRELDGKGRKICRDH